MNYSERTDERLVKEYLSGMKYCFGRSIFGGNAAKEQDKIALELESRGIHEIPNIFGPIVVDHNWSNFNSKQQAALAMRYKIQK